MTHALALLLLSAIPSPETVIEELIPDEPARLSAIQHLRDRLGPTASRLAKRNGQSAREIESALAEQIAANLIDKLGHRFPIDPPSIERTVIEYELFKAERFVSAGVFPKRYFGYFDGKFDTAELEQRMRTAIRAGVAESNAHLDARGASIRINDLEVAITFLAEGGALLLERKGVYDPEAIHPVQGIGLDDIATGFSRQPDLIARLDRRLGTHLATIVDQRAQRLNRFMTFEEAIAGTIVMWIYEKELAARKLAAAEKKRLADLPLDEQFIFSSLVYNSGLVFNSARMRMIRDFETAAYLDRLSRDNEKRRWKLPLFDAPRSLDFLLEEHRYPWQPTSWSAVYHVLQRYGAYAAIRAFTDVFDDEGRFAQP